jgi:hypothetical protein
MHNPILAAANRPMLTAPATADTALCCPTCLDTLTPTGSCNNVGACYAADTAATKLARGETLKTRLAPMAFTRVGNID